MNYIGALAIEGRQFDYKTNERLHKALELKLFEDQKDTIKLTSLVSNVVDRSTQEKIDVVKTRLIKNHGYCEICSTDVLNFVASIFARERMMPASCSSRATSASPNIATTSGLNPRKATRNASRFRRIVIHDKPAWNPSSMSFSQSARLSRSGTPHSSS
jgi:hypothetical protein